MKYRALGRTGLSVGEIGFGCEGMVEHPEWTEDFIDVMEEQGANCIDLYAPHPAFRDALGKALQGRTSSSCRLICARFGRMGSISGPVI